MSHPVPMQILKPRVGSSVEAGNGDQELAVAEVAQPFLLPHVLFAWYYAHDRRRFNQLFMGCCQETKKVQNFWRELERRQDPRVLNHPMRKRQGWQSHAVPLAIHGDGVPVFQVGKSGAKSFEAYSLQSLFVSGQTTAVKIFMFGLWSIFASHNSWLESWRIMTWSLHWLYMGQWPKVDWHGRAWGPDRPSDLNNAGKPLADGMFGVILAIKGDLEYFAKSLGLRHYNAMQMCDLCPANRCESDRSMLYNNFASDARWKDMEYDIASWKALYEGHFVHWIFNLSGINNLSLEPDELHIVHLGVSQYLQGSVLFVLVYHVMSDDPVQNMQMVFKWKLQQAFLERTCFSVQKRLSIVST